jgi:hypothetical protein
VGINVRYASLMTILERNNANDGRYPKRIDLRLGFYLYKYNAITASFEQCNEVWSDDIPVEMYDGYIKFVMDLYSPFK